MKETKNWWDIDITTEAEVKYNYGEDHLRPSEYDARNPLIWEAFRKYTFQAIYKGHKNYGSRGIGEVIRWHTPINGEGSFKVNNNYMKFFSEKFMVLYPKYEGFFRLRESKNPLFNERYYPPKLWKSPVESDYPIMIHIYSELP